MYISLLLLATVATAAVNRCTGHKEAVGYCDTLTYEDVTTRNTSPPTTSQCEATCSNILSDAGDWPISFEGKPQGWVHQIAYNDCAFSVGRVSLFDNFSTHLYMFLGRSNCLHIAYKADFDRMTLGNIGSAWIIRIS